jgi:hypothetical protein
MLGLKLVQNVVQDFTLDRSFSTVWWENKAGGKKSENAVIIVQVPLCIIRLVNFLV